jgi:hypothetical protein
VAHSFVIRLPRRTFLATAEAAYRLRLTPFGVDRAILMNGPLALDASRAADLLGWKATRSSAEVLAGALARGSR